MSIEEEVEDLKEFDSEIVAPIEEELMEVRKIFSFLPSLKRYVDWVNGNPPYERKVISI